MIHFIKQKYDILYLNTQRYNDILTHNTHVEHAYTVQSDVLCQPVVNFFNLSIKIENKKLPTHICLRRSRCTYHTEPVYKNK